MTATLAPVDRARRWRPPPLPQPWSEFARRITLPDGPHKGERWNPDTEPHQQYWIAQLEDPRWKVRVVVAPSQRGKSLSAILVPCLRTLCEEREACAYVMPSLDKLAQNWDGKIKPAIDGAGFGAWLPKSGPGSRGGKAPAQTLRDPETGQRAGTLYFMASGGGGKETALSSVTVKRPLVDEADDFESEGHILLALRRNEAYGDDGEAIIASTVNDRGEREGHPILALYGRGTRTRLWFQCPLCAGSGPTAGYQILDWSRVTMDSSSAEAARETARYVCEHCAGVWDDAARHKALRTYLAVHHGQTVDAAGNVTGPVPATTWLTILSNGLEYHMGSLPKMAAEYWAAQQAVATRSDHSAMRLFSYKVLCEDYAGDRAAEDRAKKISVEYLQIRSTASEFGPSVASHDGGELRDERRTYSRHIAPWPRRAQFGVGAIDVQGDRVYWLLTGFDYERRTWDTAWGYEYATGDRQPMNQSQLHSVLSRVDGVMHGACPQFVLGGVDTNYNTDNVLSWLVTHPNWVPVFGASAEKSARIRGGGKALRVLPGILSVNRDENWRIPQNRHHIDTTPVRMMAQNAFLAPPNAPGSAQIPSGLANNPSDRAYLQHLCGEEWDPVKAKWAKPKGAGRHDWLDCRVYAVAIGLFWLETVGKISETPVQVQVKAEHSDWAVDAGASWDISPGRF